MDRERAISWVTKCIAQWIAKAVSDCSPVKKVGLQFKAIGEYSLLLSILREYFPVEWERLVAEEEVQEFVAHLGQALEIGGSSLEECQLAHFIKIGLGVQLVCSEEIIRLVREVPQDKAVSIEHAFIMESVGLPLPAT